MSDAQAKTRLDFDTSVAHPARVYDVWLGGKDHFAADRVAAERVRATNPGIVPGVRTNRAFLARVVRYLAADVGIRQFLDLGTGLPSANNVHEVAQSVAPDARVVYVDFDPIVLAHARALLTGTPGTVAYIEADLRDPEAIFEKARDTLDLGRPVAVMLLMTLQFVLDDQDPYGLVRNYLDAVPSGSYLVVSHPASDGGAPAAAANKGTARYNELVATKMVRRSREQIAAFFDGLEVLEPGIVNMAEWRPDPGDVIPDQLSPAWCGVGRKP
ncbi:MAG: SAM-dependent methyltransferase [Kineosporiaceae bacterium]